MKAYKCEYCRNEFYKHPSAKTRFCSRGCFGRFRRSPVMARFLKHIEKTDSCWLWTSTRCPKGYGHFQVGPKAAKAHRISYELFKGQFDQKLHVLHSCDNPPCVNPEHLSLGTNAENVFDSMRKSRRFKKVPYETIAEVKRLKVEGLKNVQISKLTNLHQDYISQVVTGKIRTIA